MAPQLTLFAAPEYQPALPAAPLALVEAPPQLRRVVLVGCGSAKLTRTSRAADLYLGSLFQAAKGYVEARGAEWRILSAKHRLLKPTTRVKPYNQRMYTSHGDQMAWGFAVAQGLFYELHSTSRKGTPFEVVILAGESYAEPVCHYLEQWGVKCVRPLRGLGLGQRLRWFKERREELAS